MAVAAAYDQPRHQLDAKTALITGEQDELMRRAQLPGYPQSLREIVCLQTAGRCVASGQDFHPSTADPICPAAHQQHPQASLSAHLGWHGMLTSCKAPVTRTVTRGRDLDGRCSTTDRLCCGRRGHRLAVASPPSGGGLDSGVCYCLLWRHWPHGRRPGWELFFAVLGRPHGGHHYVHPLRQSTTLLRSPVIIARADKKAFTKQS
jgi:hypothetical protein